MKRKANIWQRQHKWIGLLLSPFIITFCLSGIALNHAEYLRHVNVNRALLPRAYRYNQWNKGRAASIENQIKQSYGIPPKTIADIPDDAMMNIDLF